MQFLKLQFRPGLNTDSTSYTNEGGWRDGDKIRFREGFPESIGGWEKLTSSTFLGTCRSLHPWVSLSGTQYIGVGTHLKFYVNRGASFFDITPIRATTSAGDVTFSATDGSTTIEVSDTGHGALTGDFVTFSGALSLSSNDAWDVAAMTYFQSFSVASQESDPTGVFFKPDGIKMYVVGSAGDSVYEYDLSAAWDVATASYLQSFNVAPQAVAPTDIFFKPDGTKMYMIGVGGGSNVNEYNLSTAWDVSSASYLQSFSVFPQEATATGVSFKPDGTKMYVVGLGGDAVFEYDLSTAWDVSSASYLQSVNVASQEASPRGVSFKPDGTKMYVVGLSGDAVFEYDLSTAWDVSSASYFQSFSVSPQETNPTGVSFKPDGTKMYVVGLGGDSVYEYSVGAITADILNAEHQLTRIVDANTYEIEVSVAANALDTGDGGAATVGEYQINTGLDSSVVGSGWGADPWGAGGWSDPATTTVPGAQLRVWSQDNFGEDLLMNIHDGGIYYWDQSSGLNARAVELSSLAGSESAPTVAKKILVSDRDRHVIAFGCDGEFTSGTQDPLLIRFSDQENLTEWRSLPDTTAGSLRIGSGSEIMTAIETKQQVLVFTDVSLHTMQYLGPPFTFGLTEIATGTSIIGQNAAVAVNDTVFWMGSGDFYMFDGTVRNLPCPVSDRVFDDLNISQADKVIAGSNSDFSEIWWFYPCSQSSECSRYVVYDYGQDLWHFGVLDRTAWIPRGVFGYPIAAAPDNHLYYHEIGVNDGSTNPPSAISSYAESSEFDLGDGYQFMFVNKIIPDVTFRGSEETPRATITLTARNFPGSPLGDTAGGTVSRTATVPVEQFTEQQYVRLRGRSMRFRIEADQYNTAWKLGSPRLGVRPDGRK